MIQIVCYGGGVNSTAILVGLHEHGERPDMVLFSDTGGEKPETYGHLRSVDEWLSKVEFPPITTLHKDSMYASLEDECLRKGTLPSLVFGWRSCSDKWKQEPQRKYLNHHPDAKRVWAAGAKISKLIGFDAGEMRRVKEFDDPKYLNRYPLIEWKWHREQCVAAIERARLPIPVKSSCFYCPASRKPEVLALKLEHPELYARAVAMERSAAPNLNVIKGLGRHWSWEELPQTVAETVQQTCMCFDGE